MSDGALLFIALVLAVAGMTSLALSIAAHWRQLFGERPQERGTVVGLRIGGAALLAASFYACALADPVSMAALVWPMVCTVAAAIVAGGLTLQARSSKR